MNDYDLRLGPSHFSRVAIHWGTPTICKISSLPDEKFFNACPIFYEYCTSLADAKTVKPFPKLPFSTSFLAQHLPRGDFVIQTSAGSVYAELLSGCKRTEFGTGGLSRRCTTWLMRRVLAENA